MTRRLQVVRGGSDNASGAAFTYSYKPGTNLVETVTASNGVKTTYGYDPAGRPNSITASKGDVTLFSDTFDYNTNNQKWHETVVTLMPDHKLEYQRYTYSYDQYDQLESVKVEDRAGGTIGSYSYSFDAVGNRTDSGYIVNDLNQYTYIPGYESALPYDDRGNMLLVPGIPEADVLAGGTPSATYWTSSYDLQDRLIEQESEDTRLEFGYDEQGRRTRKEIYAWGENQTNDNMEYILQEVHTFVYDGWELLAEYRQTNAYDSNASQYVLSAAKLDKSFVWTPSSPGGVGGLLSVTDYSGAAAQTYGVISDAKGNVIGLTNAAGDVVARYEYDPFGQLLSESGSAANVCPIRFSSKYTDAETGLVYYGYRYYSPVIGRWTSRDPIEEAGGVNLYGFVGNDPGNLVDPNGLDPRLYSQLNGAIDIEGGVMPHGKGISVITDLDGKLVLRDNAGRSWEYMSFLDKAGEQQYLLTYYDGTHQWSELQSYDNGAVIRYGSIHIEHWFKPDEDIVTMERISLNTPGVVQWMSTATRLPATEDIERFAERTDAFAGIPTTTPGFDVLTEFSLGRELNLREDIAEVGRMLETPATVAMQLNPLYAPFAITEGISGSSQLVAGRQLGGGERVMSLASGLFVFAQPVAGAFRVGNEVRLGLGASSELQAVRIQGQIAYGSSDLSILASEFRQGAGISSGRNIAVVEFKTANGLNTITATSVFGVGHAERIAGARVLELGIDPGDVTRVYSELQPCVIPTEPAGCARFLSNTFRQADVTWSFEYGATEASREAGRAALRQTTGILGK